MSFAVSFIPHLELTNFFRLRGHYIAPRSGTDHPKRMQKVYGRLDDLSEKFTESQSGIATPDTDAEGLERHGFAEKV